MGPWDPQAMILVSLRVVGMGPIIDVFIHQDASPGHKWSLADESLLRFNGYLTLDLLISEFLKHKISTSSVLPWANLPMEELKLQIICISEIPKLASPVSGTNIYPNKRITLGTNYYQIWIKMLKTFISRKYTWMKMQSATWLPFYSGLKSAKLRNWKQKNIVIISHKICSFLVFCFVVVIFCDL